MIISMVIYNRNYGIISKVNFTLASCNSLFLIYVVMVNLSKTDVDGVIFAINLLYTNSIL